nr:MAG: non-structural polyprotein [Avian associated hepe-like virus 14]
MVAITMNSNDVGNELRKIRFQKCEKDTYIRNLQYATKIGVQCSEQEQKYLTSIIPGEIIFTQQYTATHPRAKALTELANQIADRRFGRKTGRFIEIGANLADFRRRYHHGAHACLLIEDGRDQSRHLHTAFCIDRKMNFSTQYSPDELKRHLDTFDDNLRLAVRDLKNTPEICVHGTEKCSYQAPIGLAVHSLYDITPEQLYQAFYVHDLWHLTSFHYVMPMIELRNKFFDAASGFWYHVDYPKKGLITMGFSDSLNQPDNSISYIHEYKNYRSLVFDQIIHGPEFSILKETQMSWGYLQEVRYSRITLKIPRILTRFSTGLSEFVLIPNLQKYVAKNYTFDRYRHGILVNKRKYYQLLEFCESRSDDDIGYTKGSQYARAIKSEITIGERKILQHWEIDDADFSEVVMFAYVHAMVKRFKRSKLIGTAIKEIVKEMLANENWFTRQWQRICDWIPVFKRIRSDTAYTAGRVLQFTAETVHFMDHEDSCDSTVFAVCPKSEGAFDTLDYLLQTRKSDPELVLPFVMMDPSAPPAAVPAPPVLLNDEKGEFPVHPEFTDTLGSVPPFTETEYHNAFDEYVKSSLSCTEPGLDRLNSDIHKIMSTEIHPHTGIQRFMKGENTTMLVGGPGTGKTHHAVQEYVKENTLIIVPTRKLKREWIAKLEGEDKKRKISNVIVETFQLAFLRLFDETTSKSIDRVIIDEAFLFPVTYFIAIRSIFSRDLFLLGDDKQINYIDFSKTISSKSIEVMKLSNNMFLSRRTLNWCHRCPRDIVRILNRNFDYDLMPMSTVEKSIEFRNDIEISPTPKVGERKTQNLFFVQSHLLKYPEAAGCTVHEFQGGTTPHVSLVLTKDAIPLIAQSKAHLLVGITRHTETLICMSDTEEGRNCFNDQLGYMGHCLETQAKVIPHDAEKFDLIAPVATTTIHPQCPVDKNVTVFDPSSVVSIMTRALKPHETTVCGINDTHLPHCDQDIKVVKAAFNAPELTRNVRRFVGPYFAQTFRASDKVQTLNTLITRYGQQLKESSPKEVGKQVEMLKKNYEQLYIKEWSEITEDDIQIAIAEYSHSVKEKNQQDLMREFEMQKKEFNTQFILKDMVKAKVKESAVTSGKAGQGIGAWNKSLNTYFCVYFRAAERALIRSHHDYVVYANGYDDHRFWHRIRDLYNDESETFENDFSEFDSCQSEPMLEVTSEKFLKVGVPREIVVLWKTQRSFRTMVSPGFVKMNVHYKKDSGEPATLIDNTELNKHLIAALIDFEEPKLLAFKGDDHASQAKSIKIKKDFVERCKRLGIKTKIKFSKVPQFCAHFISKDGIYIDIPSRALKLLTRTFMPDSEMFDAREREFHDYKIAVADWLKTFSTAQQLDEAIDLAVEYYKDDFQFTREEVKLFASFLYAFSNPNFTYHQFRGYTVQEQQFILNSNEDSAKKKLSN